MLYGAGAGRYDRAAWRPWWWRSGSSVLLPPSRSQGSYCLPDHQRTSKARPLRARFKVVSKPWLAARRKSSDWCICSASLRAPKRSAMWSRTGGGGSLNAAWDHPRGSRATWLIRTWQQPDYLAAHGAGRLTAETWIWAMHFSHPPRFSDFQYQLRHRGDQPFIPADLFALINFRSLTESSCGKKPQGPGDDDSDQQVWITSWN